MACFTLSEHTVAASMPTVVMFSPTPDGQPVNLLAVCDTCGTLFPSGFTISGGRHYLSGNLAGPCPGCGGMGRVPDGVVDLTRPDVVAALRAAADTDSMRSLRRTIALLSSASEDELLAIREVLTAGAAERSEEQVARDVQRAAPRLAGVAGLIRNRDNRMELAVWLTLLATIIPIVLAIRANHHEVTPARQEQIIQFIVPNPSAIPAAQVPAERHSAGRNDRCPCGSGMKFKRCHGSPTERP